jgi:hypothetical protein
VIKDWFDQLSQTSDLDEVNFWQIGGSCILLRLSVRRTHNAQVIGSSPIACSSEVAEESMAWVPLPLHWFLVDRTEDRGG